MNSWKRLTITAILVSVVLGFAWAIGARVADESLDPFFGPKRGGE